MNDQVGKVGNDAQAYGTAVICLLLGIAVGYLLHAPAVVGRAPSASEGSPPVSMAAPPQMPSAADMRRMTDKAVAPLLADLEKHPNDADLLARIAHAYMAAHRA